LEGICTVEEDLEGICRVEEERTWIAGKLSVCPPFMCIIISRREPTLDSQKLKYLTNVCLLLSLIIIKSG